MSFEPKVLIAKLFSHSGVASIAAPPTPTIGEASGPTIPATSWETPTATAPQTNPTRTPRPTRPWMASGTGSDGGAIDSAMT